MLYGRKRLSFVNPCLVQVIEPRADTRELEGFRRERMSDREDDDDSLGILPHRTV